MHADQLDGVLARGCDHGVRAAVCNDGVGVHGPVERAEAVRAVGGRTGRDQGRRGGVDRYVKQGGQRAQGAWGVQRPVYRLARAVGYGPRQRVRPVVVQVAGAVPGLHDVGKQERVRSVARLIRGSPLGPADVEGERRGVARVHGGLGEPHGDRDLPVRAVHAVLRDGQRERIRPKAEDYDVAPRGKRAWRARRGQVAPQPERPSGVRYLVLAKVQREGFVVVQIQGKVARLDGVVVEDAAVRSRMVAPAICGKPVDVARLECKQGVRYARLGARLPKAGGACIDADANGIARKIDAVGRGKPD